MQFLVVKHNFSYITKSIAFELSQTHRLPVYNAYKYDKMYAITSMAERMRTGELQIEQDSVLVEECERTVYKRDDETDAILNEIDDDVFHPDGLDALLYAYRMYAFDCGDDVGGNGGKI